MKTKFTSDLLTQRLLQWVSCMGSLIQCHMNGAMELLLQLSGIAVGVVVTDRHLATKVAACVLWMLQYRQLVTCSRCCRVDILSDSCSKPVSTSSIMLNQQRVCKHLFTSYCTPTCFDSYVYSAGSCLYARVTSQIR